MNRGLWFSSLVNTSPVLETVVPIMRTNLVPEKRLAIIHWSYLCPDKGLSDNIAILELQGDLKIETDTTFDGKFIGDLHFTTSGTPVLLIGHHLLFGKEVKMDKPFALLEKGVSLETGQTEYSVKTIITKKILFRTRPKPIVGNVAKKTT